MKRMMPENAEAAPRWGETMRMRRSQKRRARAKLASSTKSPKISRRIVLIEFMVVSLCGRWDGLRAPAAEGHHR